MDYLQLAELLFPRIESIPEDYEKKYPARTLAPDAKVTRLGPSPTGFIHLGNLYIALVNERLAHQSNGIFFLRIEDTDDKREVVGAVEAVITSLSHFGIGFDEGAGIEKEVGEYGPYFQSNRASIYQCFAKELVRKGKAYPCFCKEEEIQAIRDRQELAKKNPGYYGEYATCRTNEFAQIQARIANGEPYVLRFRADAASSETFEIVDGIRGPLSMPVNEQDIVLLKQNGIPTYHFAHVIDDHLMRTTHVVRGEEWLSSLPIHVALFGAMGWPLPTYCHTTVLMKMEGETKRKLSKRKDPELSLNYYRSEGYHPLAVREYLMTILNSNYEEWRIDNPTATLEEFNFTVEKMSSSGTLFDLDKLNDISKELIVKLSDDSVFQFLKDWASEHRPELSLLFTEQAEKMLQILAMDRHGEKPRKDLIFCNQIISYISYFFDDLYRPEDSFPQQVPSEDVPLILRAYLARYSYTDDAAAWFDKIRAITEELGYAPKPKDYKKNPELYKGHVGDVSTVIRIALMGRASSPDLWEIQQIMGEEMVRARISSHL